MPSIPTRTSGRRFPTARTWYHGSRQTTRAPTFRVSTSPERISRKGRNLSGGERNRVHLRACSRRGAMCCSSTNRRTTLLEHAAALEDALESFAAAWSSSHDRCSSTASARTSAFEAKARSISSTQLFQYEETAGNASAPPPASLTGSSTGSSPEDKAAQKGRDRSLRTTGF